MNDEQIQRALEFYRWSPDGQYDQTVVVPVLKAWPHLVAVLQQIADSFPHDADPPEEEDCDDTESAYSNGMDVATYEAAILARAALKKAGIEP